jgi:hypothetical protein
MRRICVFCGSHAGASPLYAEGARRLGLALAERGVGLVYGGASVGLMGEVADAALAAGGEVIGVIPRYLMEKEVAHLGLPDLRVVDSMHQRKAIMAELSDAFIVLPGGIGTLEEFFEVWTWAQLNMHDKPCGLLNVGGYFAPLLRLLDEMTEQRFLKPAHRATLLVEEEGDALIDRLLRTRPPRYGKQLDVNAT